jgi:TPR repeat protein
MKKLLIFLVLAVMYSSVARADDLEDGYKAYEKKDYATALKLWQPLAEEGIAKAKHYLGFMYQNGYGVEQDLEEAVKWYRKAARQGHGKAQYNLGVMYEKGQGVLQDYEESVKWYRKAARKGVAGAQTNLGLMYDLGHGVIQDYVRAHMWNNLAAINGNDNGSNNRDSLAKEMTPAQISEAQDMARDCLRKNYKNCD